MPKGSLEVINSPLLTGSIKNVVFIYLYTAKLMYFLKVKIIHGQIIGFFVNK